MDNISIATANWDQDQQALIRLRTEVFVVEQKVPVEIELDGLDPNCMHVKAFIDKEYDREVIGTGRLKPDGFIGRMCVLSQYRQQQIGTRMLNLLIQLAVEQNYPGVSLNSQSYAIPFYEKCNFIIDSDEFIDAGIPHRRMILNLHQPSS